VHHVGGFAELETQRTTWSPPDDRDSPDRVDALVRGLSELMLRSRQWTIPEIEAWGRNDIAVLQAMEWDIYVAPVVPQDAGWREQ